MLVLNKSNISELEIFQDLYKNTGNLPDLNKKSRLFDNILTNRINQNVADLTNRPSIELPEQSIINQGDNRIHDTREKRDLERNKFDFNDPNETTNNQKNENISALNQRTEKNIDSDGKNEKDTKSAEEFASADCKADIAVNNKKMKGEKTSSLSEKTDLEGMLLYLMHRFDKLANELNGSKEIDIPEGEFKELLTNLKKALKSKNENISDTLLKDISDKLNKIADFLLKNTDGNDKSGIKHFNLQDLTEQLDKMLHLLAKRTGKKNEKAGINSQADTNIQETKNSFFQKTDSVINTGREERSESSFKDSSNNFNFQSSRNIQGNERGINPHSSISRGKMFEEQLQSIVQNAKIVVRDSKNGSFSIKLYPESLGKVNINLGLDQGTLTARFFVDSMEAKQAMLEHLSTIRDQLQDAGIMVGDFQVNVRDDRQWGFQNNERKDEEDIPHINVPSNSAGSSYDAHSLAIHDGAINVII